MFEPFAADKYRTPLDHHVSEAYVKTCHGMEVFLPLTIRSKGRKEVSRISGLHMLIILRRLSEPTLGFMQMAVKWR